MPEMPTLRDWLAVATCAALLASVVASPAAAEDAGAAEGDDAPEPSARIVDYQGKIKDGSGNPISGVFELVFKLYPKQDASDPVWSETRHLAVVDGTYSIPLGRHNSLDEEYIEEAQWIGVEVAGEGEILRDRFKVQSSGSGVRHRSQAEKLLERAKGSDKMAFADVAERAVTADRAEVADEAEKIGDLPADEIEHLSKRAMERLAEHKTDPNAHAASGGGLGDRSRVMDSIGGPGGASYKSTCPDGWVVAGIQGGQGRVVDSISIICKPLN